MEFDPLSHKVIGCAIEVHRVLGPGLITGASDDDPSGIATYGQAGAQFAYGLCWTMLYTLPLMAALTPGQHEVTVVDENVEPIDFGADVVEADHRILRQQQINRQISC